MFKKSDKFSKEYFSDLAERIYLLPSDKVLDMCVGYVAEMQDDLHELMSVKTENVEIFYNLPKLEMSFKTEQPNPEVENKEILKSLLKSYGLLNINTKK